MTTAEEPTGPDPAAGSRGSGDDLTSEVDLAAIAASVPASRRFITGALQRWGLAELADNAELLVSELVTNAVNHAGTTVRVTAHASDRLTVTVTDRRPDILPVPLDRMTDPQAEGGRGLTLVATLSTDWGVRRGPDRKSVWFSLPLGAGAGAGY